MTSPTIESVEIGTSTFSGFDYPQHAQLVSLLGDGVTPGGNAVLQSGALTVREATITWTMTDTTDLATLRGYYEAITQVTYTEEDGTTDHVAYITAFSVSESFHGVFNCQATLVEAP